MNEIEVKIPDEKFSGYECDLFGMRGAIIIKPSEKCLPNRFHRFMQWLCFGCVWKKI